MNATHLTDLYEVDRPFFDRKKGGIVLGGVLALHGVVGLGLSNLTTPAVKPPKVIPPLEITFITPPSVEVKSDQLNKTIETQSESKPHQKLDTPKAEPILPPKSESKLANDIATKPMQEATKSVQQSVKKTDVIAINKPFTYNITPKTSVAVDSKAPDTQGLNADQLDHDIRVLETQHQIKVAKEQEQEKIPAENTPQRQSSKNHQGLDGQRRKNDPTTPKSIQQPAGEAKVDKDKVKKEASGEQAQSKNNTPVNFSTAQGKAHLISEPDFQCQIEETEGETVEMSFTYIVDERGKIKNVTLAKSSANPKLNRIFTKRANSAKISPFIQNGVPVTGIVTLPFSCKPS